jgi:hypothetical protein
VFLPFLFHGKVLRSVSLGAEIIPGLKTTSPMLRNETIRKTLRRKVVKLLLKV